MIGDYYAWSGNPVYSRGYDDGYMTGYEHGRNSIEISAEQPTTPVRILCSEGTPDEEGGRSNKDEEKILWEYVCKNCGHTITQKASGVIDQEIEKEGDGGCSVCGGDMKRIFSSLQIEPSTEELVKVARHCSAVYYDNCKGCERCKPGGHTDYSKSICKTDLIRELAIRLERREKAVTGMREKNRRQRISIMQYESLRRNFNRLINLMFGEHYHNEGMDVYKCDEFSCRDIWNAAKRRRAPKWEDNK